MLSIAGQSRRLGSRLRKIRRRPGSRRRTRRPGCRRSGDTDLFAKVEKDLTVHGQESLFGGGKVLRDGMGVSATETRAGNPMVADLIISDAIIIDWTGIYKADIGIRDGKILAIGKGGNPDVMDNVDFIVGASTEAISGEGMIVTAGGIDLHVHYMTPDLSQAALDNGITTLFGGNPGASRHGVPVYRFQITLLV